MDLKDSSIKVSEMYLTCLESVRDLWNSLRKEARLNLYMLLILARSLITKYKALPFSARGKYIFLS